MGLGIYGVADRTDHQYVGRIVNFGGNMKSDDSMSSVELEPSVFLTNLPGIVGFYPKGHAIITAFFDVDCVEAFAAAGAPFPTDYAGPMMIKDLAELEDRPEAISAAADFLIEEGCTRADVYIIDESWGYVRTTSPIVDGLLEGGLEEVHLAGVGNIAPGEVVTDGDGNIVGIVGDSLLTPSAKNLHASGGKIFDTYEEYRHCFERGQYENAEDERRFADFQLKATNTILPRPFRIGTHNAQLIEYFQDLVDIANSVASGEVDVRTALRDDRAGYVIAASLTNVTLRDMSMMLISSPLQDAISRIWLSSAAVYTGEVRANALSCYAISQFARGIDAYGQTALNEAAKEVPEHSLTQLLDIAVANQIVNRCVGTILNAAHEVIRRVYGAKNAPPR